MRCPTIVFPVPGNRVYASLIARCYGACPAVILPLRCRGQPHAQCGPPRVECTQERLDIFPASLLDQTISPLELTEMRVHDFLPQSLGTRRVTQPEALRKFHRML